MMLKQFEVNAKYEIIIYTAPNKAREQCFKNATDASLWFVIGQIQDDFKSRN